MIMVNNLPTPRLIALETAPTVRLNSDQLFARRTKNKLTQVVGFFSPTISVLPKQLVVLHRIRAEVRVGTPIRINRVNHESGSPLGILRRAHWCMRDGELVDHTFEIVITAVAPVFFATLHNSRRLASLCCP